MPDNHSLPFAVTICKPVNEVFQYFRSLTNVALLVPDLDVSDRAIEASPEDIEELSEQWEIVKLTEEPNNEIRWQTAWAGKAIVTFDPAPNDLGTVVTLNAEAEKHKGKITGILSYYLGKEPRAQSAIILRRIKAFLETGEIPTVLGQPSGRKEDELGERQAG